MGIFYTFGSAVGLGGLPLSGAHKPGGIVATYCNATDIRLLPLSGQYQAGTGKVQIFTLLMPAFLTLKLQLLLCFGSLFPVFIPSPLYLYPHGVSVPIQPFLSDSTGILKHFPLPSGAFPFLSRTAPCGLPVACWFPGIFPQRRKRKEVPYFFRRETQKGCAFPRPHPGWVQEVPLPFCPVSKPIPRAAHKAP